MGTSKSDPYYPGDAAVAIPVKTSTSISILVPVYNEQYLIGESLGRLRQLADCPFLDRIQVIVVDDGSKDASSAVLRGFERGEINQPTPKFEWLFLSHKANQGKTAAIRTALQHATAELTVIHDADLEYHPLDIPKMVRVFFDEQADAVFGSRFLASEYRRVLFFRHQIGNSFLTLLYNLISDLNLTDMETCYKMVRTSLLKSIPLTGSGFEFEPEISIKLGKRGVLSQRREVRHGDLSERRGTSG